MDKSSGLVLIITNTLNIVMKNKQITFLKYLFCHDGYFWLIIERICETISICLLSLSWVSTNAELYTNRRKFVEK